MPRILIVLLGFSFAALTELLVPLSEDADAGEIRLPDVTGTHGVGTMVWHWRAWTGQNSAELLEVMAQLWYPGRNSEEPGSRYGPLGMDSLGRVVQASVGSAPFADLPATASLIILCPGRGMSRYSYTAVAEDLASRGFAVFGVDVPYIGHVRTPDGRVIEPSDAFQPSFELITGPYDRVDAFFEPAVAIGLAHMRFALQKLSDLNENDPAGLLTGRLNFQSIGTFGHSLGGRICGALADSDPRIHAYASMEGVPPRSVRQNGMTAASLMLYSSELPEDMALPNIRELHDNRIGPSVILRLEGFGHNSVTDRPLITPDRFSYAIDPARALTVTRTILASFFEAHLLTGEFAATDLSALPEVTLIESSID